MQKLSVGLLAVAALGLVPPAAARAEAKVAYVDLQRALDEVEEGKAAAASLKKEFEQKQKMLDTKRSELEKLGADLDKQAAVMTDQARKERQGELEKKGLELQSLFVQLRKELSDREMEAMRPIRDKMLAIVREIASQEGVSLVLQAGALVYAEPSLDITNELVRKYNGRHKAGAKKAEGTAKAPQKGKKEGK
jgi:outer membrane protein